MPRLTDDEVPVLPKFHLRGLPNELIDHVFSFLDRECPTKRKFNDQPSPEFTKAEAKPLKDVSRVSQKFRRIVLPRLFAHARLDPYQLKPFLSFISERTLGSHVKSIVAHLQGPCNHLHPAWWAQLLNQVPAVTFTIICAPHVFAEIASTNIIGFDAWAFNMPLQIAQFTRAQDSVPEPIPLNDLPSIFTARKWMEFSVNEGSSLKAYTTYEYFLRRTPSLIATLHARKSVTADAMFANLKYFSFTAIFPFYNHVDEIMKVVKKMKKLKTLRTKLCPEPESTVLSDEIVAAQGHIDVNDPWNELNTAYTLVAHAVICLTVEGQLTEFQVDDVRMEGIRETIEASITQRLQQWWAYPGGGVWRRSASVEIIRQPAAVQIF